MSLSSHLINGSLLNFITVASLCRKYQKAKATVETMHSAVEELTKSIGNSHWISQWKKLEEVARVERGKALMIYNVSYTPGMFQTPVIIPPHPYLHNQYSSITSEETTRSHEEWQKG